MCGLSGPPWPPDGSSTRLRAAETAGPHRAPGVAGPACSAPQPHSGNTPSSPSTVPALPEPDLSLDGQLCAQGPCGARSRLMPHLRRCGINQNRPPPTAQTVQGEATPSTARASVEGSVTSRTLPEAAHLRESRGGRSRCCTPEPCQLRSSLSIQYRASSVQQSWRKRRTRRSLATDLGVLTLRPSTLPAVP